VELVFTGSTSIIISRVEIKVNEISVPLLVMVIVELYLCSCASISLIFVCLLRENTENCGGCAIATIAKVGKARRHPMPGLFPWKQAWIAVE